MMHLASAKGYVHFFDIDQKTNKLRYIFMAHPEGAKLFKSYPYVVGIDSTYKTNLYGMPFVNFVGVTPVGKSFLIAYALLEDETSTSYEWALNQLKLMLDSIVPNVFITDREKGLLLALSYVFPNTPHMLCLWYINTGLENRATKFYGDALAAQNFRRYRWKPMVEMKTVVEFENAWNEMKNSFHKHELVDYLESTWMLYATNFAKCYTDKILHFGSRTISRVESAYGILKSWLSSSTLALDSIWQRVDSILTVQHSEIRKELEMSRSKNRHDKFGTMFAMVKGGVSHRALELMEKEIDRGLSLGYDLIIQCGCTFELSYGLPCACSLIMRYYDGGSIYPSECHEFWRTLVFHQGPSTDLDRFEKYVNEARKADATVLRDIKQSMSSHLYLEYEELQEPSVKETRKGRPSPKSFRF
ncbi:hypothetical protein RND81_13G087700 [Saponaria officinalis]|uniref:MULE transposase domain-containing protein n=1 Tax=Saponaria officinalis TaxID=3572 RepID=A0AAW1GVI1_SAPOF